jgi:glycosyltransferase involved in cell wall biosynthesis
LNFIGYREPGYLWKLGVPFFWGPVAGAQNLPWRYFGLLSWRDRLGFGLRNIANEFQKRLAFRPRRAARAATQIWVAGEENRRLFSDIFGVPSSSLCPVGTERGLEGSCVKAYDPGREALKLIFVGNQIGLKGLPIVLQAMARLRNAFPIRLVSVGSGPERDRWQDLARRLQIGDQITWLAEVPHQSALAEMARSHVLAFPSLQEGSPAVILEALSLGLPVLCHDACGMRSMVTAECGIKVPMTCSAESIDGFAGALRRLNANPAEVGRLSRGALARSAELTWDAVAREIANAYDRVLGEARAVV